MTASAGPRNVAKAVVIKAGDIFFLSQKTGEVPKDNQDGYGLYYHDCRFLDGYELQIEGTTINPLGSSADRGSIALFELTNNELSTPDGSSVKPQTFGIKLKRVIDNDALAVHDLYTIENYDVAKHTISLSFRFSSSFEDVFEIRGLNPKKVGKDLKPAWMEGVLVLSYKGADGVDRRLEIHPEPEPRHRPSGAEFVLDIEPGGKQQIRLTLHLVETREQPQKPQKIHADPNAVVQTIADRTHQWLGAHAEISSDDRVLNEVMNRSLLDLGILKSVLDDLTFFSAGLPWYGALFGRDSIIAGLETLAYEPQMAEQTIRLLAKYQGTKVDDWRDEQPGKILHEYRRGELANLNEIAQTPYYGSVDSTPLFLILVGEHANWTGSLSLFQEVRQNVERALEWIDKYGTQVDNRYVSYASKSSKGLGNQGWKDSGDSIMNADGSLAQPPIALVEVQGYVYRAKLLIADLYARSGDQQRAGRLRKEAESLKADFNRDFWIDDKQFYAIALQKGGKPAAVISSNPGQALWTGIIDDNRATAVVQHLLAEDMFSGWGIRTLSQKEKRFNPIGYHLGTVWPHDNGIITAGLRRYGFEDEALTVFNSILQAAAHFEHFRLPEVFAGFTHREFHEPVRYPVACHPQAWAAGSVPFMLTTLLGLNADAFNSRLRIVDPLLPKGIDKLDLRRVKIAGATFDLHFRRSAEGSVEVRASGDTGKIKVDVEAQERRKAA